MEEFTDMKENCCFKDSCRKIPGQVLMNSNCQVSLMGYCGVEISRVQESILIQWDSPALLSLDTWGAYLNGFG